MSITLNEIAYSIAHTLGTPNDFFLREKIKLSAIGVRATLIRQDLTRNTLSKAFLQSIGNQELTCVDVSQCPATVPTGTYMLRTINKIPKPVRTKDNSTFYYVGIPDKTRAFQETTIDGIFISSEDRYTSRFPKYFYLDGYIYVINPPTDDLKYITIISPFADPREIASFKDCPGADCYTDDSDFPLEMDMWMQMEGILLSMYRGSNPTEDEEVRLNSN